MSLKKRIIVLAILVAIFTVLAVLPVKSQSYAVVPGFTFQQPGQGGWSCLCDGNFVNCTCMVPVDEPH